MADTAPARKIDAFLLYNGEEATIPILEARLTERGVATWFTERDQKPIGASFDDASAYSEQQALKDAAVCVVFLGQKGWGPNHLRNTASAQRDRKPLIRVLIGTPNQSALNELDGLFLRTPPAPLTFRDTEDTQALEKLTQFIRKGGVPPVFASRPLLGKPAVNVDRIIRQLLSGDPDDREDVLDELAGLVETNDLSDLKKRILANLPEFEKATDRGGVRARESLLGALVFALDWSAAKAGQDPDAVGSDSLARHLDPSVEQHFEIRWRIRASILRRGVGFDPAAMPDLDPYVNTLFLLGHRRDEFNAYLGQVLQSQDMESLDPYLLAFGQAPQPDFIPDICAVLNRHPGPAALAALTAPAIIDESARQLLKTFGTERTTELAVAGSQDQGRHLLRRLVILFSRMDQDAVRAALRRANATVLLQAFDAFRRHHIAGYCSDTTASRPDDLGIMSDVQTLCAVMLSTDVEPPLSIGLFGDWGTGKSFFMDRMFEEVDRLTGSARNAAASKFHTQVAQIKFNAWNYIDANLWASLVSHIMEKLVEQVKPAGIDAAATRKQLVGNLETAKTLRAEAEAERTSAQTARQAAETNLHCMVADRAQQQLQLKSLHARDFWQWMRQDEKLSAEVDAEARELQIPDLLGHVSDLQAAMKDVVNQGARVKAILQSLRKQPLLIVLIVLLLAAPAVAWAFRHSIPHDLPTRLAALGAWLAGILTLIQKPLQKAKEALKKLEDTRNRASNWITARQKAAQIEVEKKLKELQAKEDSASHQLAAAESRVHEIEAKIAEIDEGRSFTKYLLLRFQSDDYRKYLGLISTIRADFEKLASLLSDPQAGATPPASAPGEPGAAASIKPIRRIILYIDDLDRCPAPRVMEVLQAVHLLLAFPLFVVVVGVDPRWLLHSLEQSYSAFQEVGPGRDPEWLTTPQNYLEKIFQIPFVLRPMEAAGYSRLMRSLLPATVPSADHQDAAPVSPVPKPMPRPDPITAFAGPPDPDVPHALTAATPPEPSRPELEYEAQLIQPWELDFAQRLFTFFPSPRAVKRFTNIYRLLKAPLTSEELRRFEGTDSAPGDFRAAMALLAVLTGFPESATQVFRKLLDVTAPAEGPEGSPSDFFKDEETCKLFSTYRDRYTRCIPFLLAFRPSDWEPFTEWLPRVARFSFDTAKL